MKKTLQYLLFSLLALSPLFLANTAFAQGETVDFPYDSTSQVPVLTDDNPTDISEVLNDDAITPSNSILDRLTKFFRVS